MAVQRKIFFFFKDCLRRASRIITMKGRSLRFRTLGYKRDRYDGALTEEEVKHIVLNPVPEGSTEVPQRKYALLLSFNGYGYFGMQKNSFGCGYPTIEEELLSAMLSASLITEEQYQVPQLFSFQRTSRTDKNVSAARMLVSGNFNALPLEVKEAINKRLSSQIRVMAVYRVTKGFNCKVQCNARSYSYLCPTFAFAPCTEVMNANYRMSWEVLQGLREILWMYKGTHNFHNFTIGLDPGERRATRVIWDIDCDPPFERYGWEWIRIRMRGQSFLLHQIRKMMAVAMAVSQGLTNLDFLAAAFSQEFVALPRAPALGLVLEDQHFYQYNRKFASYGAQEALNWDAVEEEIQKFCKENIYSSIMHREMQENSMLGWLVSLHFHTYQTDPSKEAIKKYSNMNRVKYSYWKELRDPRGDGTKKSDSDGA